MKSLFWLSGQAAAWRLDRRKPMLSLLLLATLYLFAALVLIFIIDRSVGIMFPASTEDTRTAAHPPLPDASN
ncbi:hypothetical protein NXC24_PC00868 (plasmid) [Rhizobium sp. NXC24]|nr:hypothetical protein NXC24_PC00868 [Rhizobium sp. NXC24]